MPLNFIQSYGNFSDAEIERFNSVLVKKAVPKKTMLLREGEICRSLFFVQEGAFIQYNYKDEIDQQIIDLHIANEWMLNQQSFVRQQPSETIIEAYTDSVVYEMTVNKMHELIGISPIYFQLAKLIEPAHSRVYLFDNQLSPVEKYEYILNSRPTLLQYFPLKLIASYLKLTPETLSRVREKRTR